MLALPPFFAKEANSYWLSCSQFLSSHQLWTTPPNPTHPHFLLVVLFPAGLEYFPSSSLVFVDVSSTSLFSIWNLFYPLSGSIDLLSSGPPASWCPLFTVTPAMIAWGSLLIISMPAAAFPAEAIEPSRLSSRKPRGLPGLVFWPDNSLRALDQKTKSSWIFF